MVSRKPCMGSLLILGFLATCFLPCCTLVCFASDSSVDSMTFTSRVTLYSPINKTYNFKFLTLNLTSWVGIGVTCTITYNIDNQHRGNIPLVPQRPKELHMLNEVAGNVTLPELTEGTHNLTLQVVCNIQNSHKKISEIPVVPKSSNYTFNTATWTDTIQFTIKTSEQQIPEFSSITTVVMVGAVMMLAVTIYQKNYKKWVC